MRKQGTPRRNELVVCKIVKIFPNSALAELVEYRKRGMIHVSEVALRWVKDIREFLKQNQYVVCRVMRIDRDDILLSVKRVRREDSDRTLNEFKRERKAEKMLELKFAFKNPELLKSKGVPKTWQDPIVEIANKGFSEKEYVVKAKLKIMCYGPDGIKTIKKALSSAGHDGLEIRYVSAPNYVLVGKGKNFKELKAKVHKTAEGISEEMSRHKGTCDFEIEES
jgi:translation initiation factor 2 subunit 1